MRPVSTDVSLSGFRMVTGNGALDGKGFGAETRGSSGRLQPIVVATKSPEATVHTRSRRRTAAASASTRHASALERDEQREFRRISMEAQVSFAHGLRAQWMLLSTLREAQTPWTFEPGYVEKDSDELLAESSRESDGDHSLAHELLARSPRHAGQCARVDPRARSNRRGRRAAFDRASRYVG